MSILGRDRFARDLLVLLVVGITVASLFSVGVAVTTDKYFARAVTGLIGDYGQYDLIFQVRSELFAAAREQLAQIIAERFPGSRLKSGVSIAGKSTIFLGLAPRFHAKDVFERLGSYFGDLPGGATFSIITEPRLIVSGVPVGAQDLIMSQAARLSGVDFLFRNGEAVNIVLKSAKDMDDIKRRVQEIVGRYQLVEVRFPVGETIAAVGEMGRELEQQLDTLPKVTMVRDVTRGRSNDGDYLSATLGELRRFMVSYAARIKVQPVADGPRLTVGDRLILQGRASRLPVPGQKADKNSVVVKIDKVKAGAGEGLIVQGDASFIENPSAFRLLPGDKVGDYVGTITVSNERELLGQALGEGAKLLEYVRTLSTDPNQDAAHSLSEYEGILDRIGDVRRLLTLTRDGLGRATDAETRENLRQAADQINGIAGDLDRLSATMARISVIEGKISPVLDQLAALQSLLRLQGDRPNLDQGPNGLGQRLTAAVGGLAALGEDLRQKARRVDDFINRFNPLVQVLSGWGKRAKALAERIDYLGGVLTPGSQARETFESLLGATESTLRQLDGLDGFNILKEMYGISNQLAAQGPAGLDLLIDQMRYLQDSLPHLLDEEIGRSVGLIDRYIDSDSFAGERIQIVTNATVDTQTLMPTVKKVAGRNDLDVLRLPIGSLEPDLRGQVYQVLGEVRTTITALVLLALFILEFLLDQTLIVAMLRRQTDTISRRMLRGRPRLARRAGLLLNPARLYAAGIGALWLWICFTLTGAGIPFLSSWGVALLGAALGLVLSYLAERVNPVNQEEVMAGESLGLPFVSIMREIVIPAGRPGLLQLLNRRRLIMRERNET